MRLRPHFRTAAWGSAVILTLSGQGRNEKGATPAPNPSDPGGLTATEIPASQQRVLFLWGGVDAEGTPHLDPAFVLDAPPSLPRSDGRHRIVGLDADGTELFALRFEMPVIADDDGSSSFVFALPVREGWADALANITLSGPGGSFTLDRNTDLPMAILRDPESGQIRQIMRDLPSGPRGLEAAERMGTESGFEVLFSRGIPDPADWRP